MPYLFRQRFFPEERIHVFTFSDRVADGLCISMASAAKRGFPLNVLGVDSDIRVDVRNRKLRKLYGISHFLSSNEGRSGFSDWDVLLFGDANDVLYFSSADDILAEFRRLSQGRKQFVLFAGERNCWPYRLNGKELMEGGNETCGKFPTGNSTFRYLNSGGYIGRIDTLRKLISAAMDGIKSNSTGDQLVFQELYLASATTGLEGIEMYVDFDSRIFQTGHRTQLETQHYKDCSTTNVCFDSASNKIVNSERGTRPAILHLNGGKDNFPAISRSVLREEEDSQVTQQILQSYELEYAWYVDDCETALDVSSPRDDCDE